MQLTNELIDQDFDQMVNFYKENFDYVAVVYCNKCEAPVAIIVASPKTNDWMGLTPNDLGQAVIAVHDRLKSSRVRLDLTPAGERMIGFQCKNAVPNPAYAAAKKQFDADLAAYEKRHAAEVKKAKEEDRDAPEYSPPILTVSETLPCGNDTRLAEVEVGMVPVGATPVNYANPFEKHQILEKIKKHPTYKPDFEEAGHIRRYETFRVERV